MTAQLVTGQGGTNNWGGNANPPVSNPIVWISDHTSAPTVDDDLTRFFGVGSIWLDVSDLANPVAYMCFSALEGAAVWQAITVSAGAVADAENDPAEAAAIGVYRHKVGNTLHFYKLYGLDGSVVAGMGATSPGPGGVPPAYPYLNLSVDPSKISLANLGSKSYDNLDDLPDPDDADYNAAKIQGVLVDATAPTDAQALVYDEGSGKWKPAAVPVSVAADLDISSMDAESTPASGMKMVVDDGGTRKKIDWNQLPGAAAGESNTGSNVGATGEGVFDAKVGIDLQFRKLAAGTGMAISLASQVLTIAASAATALWNALKLQGVEIATAAPTNGQVLAYNSGTGKWTPTTQSITRQVAVFNDTKSATTAGGSSIAGAQIRTLNTTIVNTIAGCALSGNRVTLPAGTYHIQASVPGYRTNEHCAFLWNYTLGATIAFGSSEYAKDSSYGAQTRSIIDTVFTLANESQLELRQFTMNAQATNGLGYPPGAASSIYSQIMIERFV